MRVHDVRRLRAVGVQLDWLHLARPMLERDNARHWLDGEVLARLEERGPDVRLAWGCSADLGVPREAFTVWVRRVRDRELRPVPDLLTFPLDEGELVWWGGEEAAHVRVRCDVQDPGQPVSLFLLRTGLHPEGAVGAGWVSPGGSPTVGLTASAGAATHAVLVNAHATDVEYTPVQDVVDADDWTRLEVVGLPVDDGGLGAYPPDDQGMVDDPMPPVQAALRRLDRVGSPLGWYPVTESGRVAPPWVPTDPAGIVKETRAFLLPEIEALYAPGVAERHQQDIDGPTRTVDPPSRPEDGVRADQPATATVKPLALLMMPAYSDPSTNVATGFGTAYRVADLPDGWAEVEFLVTALYRESVLGDDVEVAAYVPPVEPHLAVPPVVDLTADRAALMPPHVPDGPFRESVEVGWRHGPRTATLTGPVVHAFVGWTGGAAVAEDLLPPRLLGGSQPRTIPRPENTTLPGADRPKVVHGDQDLPIDGSVQRGYAVAQADIFGVWSPWEDVTFVGTSPTVLPPRIGRLALDVSYTGSAVCPSELVVELAVDRTQRTAATLEVRAVLYPMPAGATPPPAGLVPGGPVPAPCHALARTVTFTGDVGDAAPDVLVPLRDDGSVAPSWGAPEQPAGRRAYRLVLTGPGLDFGPRSRWGAQVWVRQTSPGIAAPSVWTPVPEFPATTTAPSPVPAVPVPPPLPPDVPLASTPDAQGLCHVRVTWTGLASPHVDRVVVWEAAETTLRERIAPGNPPDRAQLPGVRLAQLWTLYDATPAAQRRLGFRRAAEVPAGPGAADLTLPRGSQDIHVFVVTAVTTTGVESDWPGASGPQPAHAHLQATTAPRLRRPAMPVARPAVAADGSVRVTLQAASPIDVTAFEVFATRSETAARNHLTMGPPHATVTATAAVDPGTAQPLRDAITRDRVWAADWAGALPPSWEPWHLRAVAVPRPTVGPAAERGIVSPASDVVTVSVLPAAAPDLDPLVAEVRGADHTGVLVRTRTNAADRVVPAGSHTVQLSLAGADAARQALQTTARVGDDSSRPDTTAGPVVQRLPRVAGTTPLLVWAHRDDPSLPVEVVVRVADPLGRETERSIVVPGWVEPAPELTFEIADVFQITGRGTVVDLRTNADPTRVPPYTLTVVATLPGLAFPFPFPPVPPRLPVPGRPPIPGRPLFGGAPGPVGPLRRTQSLRASWSLADIPERRSPVPPRAGTISAVRSRSGDVTSIGLWIPSTEVTGLTVNLSHPDDGDLQRAWSKPR